MDLLAFLRSPLLQEARARAHTLDRETLDEQVTLALIPAPPFGEAERAEYVRSRFESLGLEQVETDAEGNVLGRVPRAQVGDPGAHPLIVSAHLDTVFPPETRLRLRRAGERVMVPGIADNARGLTAVLTLCRIVMESDPFLTAPLVFAATVGEEGVGDLRGVKHLFRTGSPLCAARGFISIDGSGLHRVVDRGVGSARFRVSIRGAGGHSWADWGMANPVSALGGAIAALSALALPQEPRTTLTVARCGGGTSINAIPQEAWMELDLRSEDAASLERLERDARAAVQDGLRRENRRRRKRTPALDVRWETIGIRPAGGISARSSLVEHAITATREVGMRPELVASSTDSNVPLARGIPAVTIGAGGSSGGIHTLEEWYSNEGGALGIERALLLVAAAGRE
jgi:tripeptide aminopeptidase